MMNWEEVIKGIKPVTEMWLKRARERLDDLTKPRGSLGVLEDLAARYAAIKEEIPITMPIKKMFIFVGDHDVVAEGVSAYPQEVTSQMTRNILSGGAGVNVLATCAGAEVFVIDMGMKEELTDDPELISRKVRKGAGNITRGPAMSREEAETALNVGIEMALKAHGEGASLIATGDMGIGNTTPSAALFSVLLPAEVEAVTGRGTGLDDNGLTHKIEVIKKAIQVNRRFFGDPISILAGVGGLEIAGISGLCLGGAACRMAVVVDGFISTAGALVAMRINPTVKDYLFFSHQSNEKGHQIFFQKEGLRPLLDLDLRLGEGTGAAIGMQIIEDGIRIFNEMATFKEVGIAPGA
ncbi:MAG: nicotinate-nucleotide--dimethylbenzimidazole phosphoribosyltransferase [Thermodesulfobacteriota bacterium]|nr:nicotinate-nucleotide--dimethylbenzimidazole phosphoribosyltransferase [Thermodesulfobacteriota bacterium]